MALSSTRRTILPPKDDLEHLFRPAFKRSLPRRAAIATARRRTCRVTSTDHGEWCADGTALKIERTGTMSNFLSRRFIYLLTALLLGTALVTSHRALSAGESGSGSSSASYRPDLDYLKAVNSTAPPRDPELVFLLMAEYSNANLQGEGAEFFEARLKEFDSRLTAAQKALYLSAIGLLRAQHATSISLLHRIAYVKETISILEQAKQLSGGQVFVVNWVAGIVHAELPRQFDQRKAAEAELGWCLENADKAPHAGWLREIYYHLGKLAVADGEQTKARDYLQRSGYKNF